MFLRVCARRRFLPPVENIFRSLEYRDQAPVTMHVGFFDDELRSTNKPKDNPDMKTFSLATLTGALMFTSSLAVAGPRPGPDFDHRHHLQLRAGHARPGLVVRLPAARVAPHCVIPSVAAVFTPRVPVVTPRYVVPPRHVVSAHQHTTHVAPAPAPVEATPQVPASPPSGGGKPPKPSVQGSGGTKPTKPGQPTRPDKPTKPAR
jgi:hypothetical protein